MPVPGLSTIAAPAAYTLTTSGLFAIRNADKTSDGDIGRLPVLIGQTYKFIDNISQNVGLFDNLAKSESVFVKRAVKAADFASKNINNLIMASSAIKVLQADKDDLKETLITEVGGLAGMFAGEGWMKKHLDDKLSNAIKKLSSKDIDISVLKGKPWYNILRGGIFVIGSIVSSTVTGNAAKEIAPSVSNPFAPVDSKNKNRMA